MSTRYPGGIITKSPATPTGPYDTGAAPGIWTLEQQLQYQKQGVWPTAGLQPNFIEDVFSTYLYTGNGSTQTITNGIDLSGKGGLVWLKSRGSVQPHWFVDTARGVNKRLESNNTNAESTLIDSFPSFNANGFTLGTNAGNVNTNGVAQCSWTFRKQPKFFDIVTYTGDGTNRTIAHNLGSVPGCVIVKCTSNAVGWNVYHRSLTSAAYQLELNTTSAQFSDPTIWNSTAPTSTEFSVGTNLGINGSGRTYVAYLFAHNAGGFGLTGTDNVISCGSYNRTDGVKSVVNLGYEPQFIIQKNVTGSGQWVMLDTMRSWTGASNSNLFANLSNAETTGNISTVPTATGFEDYTTAGATDTLIYIAIRRGPMKVPTSGTSVYANSTRSATAPAWTSNFPVDWFFQRTTSVDNWATLSRLTGTSQLRFNTTDAATTATEFKFDFMNGINGSLYADSTDYGWMMRRAPGFFDEVCWTGVGGGDRVLTHNLGVAPEMMIMKCRTVAGANWQWWVYHKGIAPTPYPTNMTLNTNEEAYLWSPVIKTPTTTTFTVGDSFGNLAPEKFVAYLFATCPGVSKVGSYTGAGTTQVINCGFTSGARFVLIKRTDSTGDWYVWDSARGIVAGNDPYILLNSTAAEVTGTDYVDTASSGFEISSTAPAAINANGGSFIFLAIA